MRHIILIGHNIRSTHNVGSLLRTAEGLGLEKIYLTGYTPYPLAENDIRLPHLARKIEAQIQKTALGAQISQAWEHKDDIEELIRVLKQQDYEVVAIEQAPGSIALPDYQPQEKIALIVGREVEGIEPEILALANKVFEIPMFGKKESFNVAQAAAMALYHCRFA